MVPYKSNLDRRLEEMDHRINKYMAKIDILERRVLDNEAIRAAAMRIFWVIVTAAITVAISNFFTWDFAAAAAPFGDFLQ